MMHTLLAYLQTSTAAVRLTANTALCDFDALLVPAGGFAVWAALLKQAAVFAPAWLVDHGAFEVAQLAPQAGQRSSLRALC